MFQLWRPRTLFAKLLESGKRQRGYSHPTSRECPQFLTSACTTEYIPTLACSTLRSAAAYVEGKINNCFTSILLDSGASCSVIGNKYIAVGQLQPVEGIQLINADGRSVLPAGTAEATVCLGNLLAHHSFMVLNELSSTAILGCDFLTKHNLVIDFSRGVAYPSKTPTLQLKLQHSGDKSKACKMLTLDDELPQAIPTPMKNADIPSFDMPTDVHPALQPTIESHRELFLCNLARLLSPPMSLTLVVQAQ